MDDANRLVASDGYHVDPEWRESDRGRGVLAKAYRHGFKQLALDFRELIQCDYDFQQHEALLQSAGELLIAAAREDLLQAVPYLANLVAWHTREPIDILKAAKFLHGPVALFVGVVGRWVEEREYEDEGEFHSGFCFTDALLPAICPPVFGNTTPYPAVGDAHGHARIDQESLLKDAAACDFFAELLDSVRQGTDATQPSGAPPKSDGPFGLNQWRFNGQVLPGRMTQTRGELARILYARFGHRVPYDDLMGNGKLFDNGQELSCVRRHGTYVSEWFAKRDVPLIVHTDKTAMWMEKNTKEE